MGKTMIRVWAIAGVLWLSFVAHAESTLIENVRIFNGVDAELESGHVLVEDGVIKTISSDNIEAPEQRSFCQSEFLHLEVFSMP